MIARLFLLSFGVLLYASSVTAQTIAQNLQLIANNYRLGRGLSALTYNAALTAAAQNHASWMAQTGRIEHRQDDGSQVRDRAIRAGYTANYISEIIYLGGNASPQTALNWWLGSPDHRPQLDSQNYNEVGIGTAIYNGRRSFVMVMGRAVGDAPSSGAGNASSSGGSAPAAQPAYILGLDEFGNIKHEVQPGHTIGDIALIYGYTWDDIPAMLELNDLTTDDIRWLQSGSVFLVPPKDGTFTPTSPAPTAAATSPATTRPTPRLTDTPAASTVTPEAAFAAMRELRIERLPRLRATPLPAIGATPDDADQSITQLLMLGTAILVQLGVLGLASLELLKRSRKS